jgi:dihydrofolate synthase/folylpolyglutamate synthase
VSIISQILSPHEWAAINRRDDGEQQPISPVEREFGAESHGRRHGLDVIRAMMAEVGNPHLSYPTIHVGGSKGKGSTVAMLSAILRSTGYRVGAYTSPSLTEFGERIAVNGRPMTDADAERYVAEMRAIAPRLPDTPRFFEAATGIAFRHFADQAVDVAIIEVGLGGRLDATNVVSPELAVITSIELEHTQILGSTLGAIAFEKAGIIKPGVATITGVGQPQPLGVIERACAERDSALLRLGSDFKVEHKSESVKQQQFDFRMRGSLGDSVLENVTLALPGEAQNSNAALAIAAARVLGDRFDRLSESVIRRGLESVRWPGRLELIDGRPPVLLDVAHTPASAHQLRRYLDRFFAARSKTLVVGMLRDKKVDEVAAELCDAFDNVVVAPVKWFRSMEVDSLLAAFQSKHSAVDSAPTICRAIEQARKITPPDGLIVVAGSLFAVGEAKRRFGW